MLQTLPIWEEEDHDDDDDDFVPWLPDIRSSTGVTVFGHYMQHVMSSVQQSPEGGTITSIFHRKKLSLQKVKL